MQAAATGTASSTPSASIRRIEKELNGLNITSPILSAGPIDPKNLLEWAAIIQGPPNTPYENGQFKLLILFTELYPLKPPQCQMQTKVFHPNITEDQGEISLDLLSTSWKPTTPIATIIQGIYELLERPHGEKCLEVEKGKLYLENRDEFNRLAKDYTDKYAKQ
ncbi:unnamed protein product [Didymodactylos carnosus]|uniref:UBC core domain-containing protein n=1 Tax=Didymodactylos carnosus TaxID=1234261 RepID=A0A814DU94_9BILA|nr:unnamed protein product [Didymodactylos carnosus]CAF1442282.1 unnamed protein product [Didymodactylos carnosus]CAF3733524.1 unnamed protein product [Didymodactylos carnosus]CAF4238322.1 unnamed protein product [Didymodactylos carnosus]